MSGSRQVTNFGDWEKIGGNQKINIFGIKESSPSYYKQTNDGLFTMGKTHFASGVYLSYDFTAYDFTELDKSRLTALLDKLHKGAEIVPEDKSEHGLGWNDRIGKINKFIRTQLKAELSSHCSDELDKLAFAVKVIAEFASFPAEMVDDILSEIKNRLLNTEHMNDLTRSLVKGDPKTIKEIKDAYRTYGQPINAMAWIQILVNESRYLEAISWCNTFSEDSKYVEPKRIILHCLMQLKDAEEKANKKSQLEEKVSSGLDEDENTFTYLEKLFKCSWEIAKVTNKEEDISQTLHYLDELSGGSGLERAYINIKSLDEVDILIQRARTIRELREDNTQSRPARELREEIAKKDSKIAEMDAEINRLKAEIARLRDAQLQNNSAAVISPRFSQSPNAFMPAVPTDNGSQRDIGSSTENRYFPNQN